MLVGGLSLFDVLHRATDLRAFYTDEGILPRARIIEEEIASNFPWWSMTFHSVSGRWEVQALLLALAGVFSISLILGYRTRLSTFLVWLFNLSIQSRNPMVLQAGDMLHRLLLFWGMFLPWSELASLDRAFRKRAGGEVTSEPRVVTTVGTAAYLIQVGAMYFFTALLKSAPEWRIERMGVYYALSVEQFSTPFGLWLLKQRWLMRPMNDFVLWLEGVAPLLVISPYGTQWLRLAAIGLLSGMQLGFWLCMELGSFPFCSTLGYAGALPPIFWDFIPPPWKASACRWGERLVDKLAWLEDIWPAPKPWPPRLRLVGKRVAATLAGIFIVHAMLWNVGTLSEKPIRLLEATRWISNIPRLDQWWNMFAPFPLKDDGWYVIPGVLRNGTQIDVYAGGAPVSWEKPKLISATYRNFRWRKYMMNLWLRTYNEHRILYGRYLCREWNKSHGPAEQLMTFEIFFMLKETQPDYREPTVRKESLWRHHCF